MIIDIHSHLDRDPITKKYKVEELLKDMVKNNIDLRVVSTMFGPSISAANDFIVELVRKYPNKLIGCAVINPKDDNSVEETKRICQLDEIKMVEFDSLEHGYRPEKVEYNLLPILQECDKNNKIVKVFTGHGFWTMPDQWMYYFNLLPNLKVIFEHMGGTDFSYGTVDLVKESRDKIYLDTSYESEMQPLMRAFDELPKEIFLYGSNYPKNFTNLSILKFDDLNLNEEILEHLFHKNAEKLFNLSI